MQFFPSNKLLPQKALSLLDSVLPAPGSLETSPKFRLCRLFLTKEKTQESI